MPSWSRKSPMRSCSPPGPVVPQGAGFTARSSSLRRNALSVSFCSVREMQPDPPIHGTRRVEIVYSLAVFAVEGKRGRLPAGSLLVGRVGTDLVFATAMFQIPLLQIGLARDTA